jgi:hypothetical protein
MCVLSAYGTVVPLGLEELTSPYQISDSTLLAIGRSKPYTNRYVQCIIVATLSPAIMTFVGCPFWT